jgi:hypothetical protein
VALSYCETSCPKYLLFSKTKTDCVQFWGCELQIWEKLLFVIAFMPVTATTALAFDAKNRSLRVFFGVSIGIIIFFVLKGRR